MSDLSRLIARAQRGELALLVGQDLSREITNAPSGQELAQGLAERWGLPATDSLAGAAEGLSRWQYVRGFLRTQGVLPRQGEAGDMHKAIAHLPLPFLLTTAYDNRLVQALDEANRPAKVLVEDGDWLPGWEPGLDQPALIRLCGSPDRSGTLVVAGSEYAALTDRLRNEDRWQLMDDLARSWLREKAWLLVGCDPTVGSDFERHVYGTLLRWLGEFDGDSCLVWPQPTDADVSRWSGRKVTLIDAQPVAFFQDLKQGLQGQEITLPRTAERAALENLGEILRGKPTTEEVRAAAQAIPARQRPRSIRLTLTFRLSESSSPTLRSAVDLEYLPDIAPYFRGEFQDTGISLQQLEEWTGHADLCRKGGLAPEQYPPVSLEELGIQFLSKILRTDSGERDAYARALELSQILQSRLQIVFQPVDARGRLSPVPWELLHDGFVQARDGPVEEEGGHVNLGRGFLARKYPVYRRLLGFASVEQAGGQIGRALIVAADRHRQTPRGLDGLDKEAEEIAGMLRALGVQATVLPTSHPDLSDPEAIKRRLRVGGTHLLHFSGHGLFNPYDPAQSKLMLGREPDEGDLALTATELAEVARDTDLVLVFMNACQVGMPAEISEMQPWREAGFVDAFARAGVPAVVGMRYNVGNPNARTAAHAFYTALLKEKQPAEQALMIARQAVGEKADWVNPILTKRHGLLEGAL